MNKNIEKTWDIPHDLIDDLAANRNQEEANKDAIIHITKYLGTLRKESDDIWGKIYAYAGLDAHKEAGHGKYKLDMRAYLLTRLEDQSKPRADLKNND